MAEQVVITRRASTLPPDYVSWAQLRERWLLKQQQQKELEAKQNAILENQETGLTDGNKVENQTENTDGNKVENQFENKKKRKTNKSRKNRKKKQPFVDGKLENHQNEEFVSKIGKGNETEIGPKKPIGETSGVSQKNGNNGAGNGVEVSRAKIGDETKGNNGHNKKGNRKKVGGNRFGNNEVENHVESSKGKEKSKSLNEMGKSEVLAVGDETKGTNGYNKRGNRKKVGGNRFGNNEVENHVESSKGSEKSKSLNEMSKSEVLAVGDETKGNNGYNKRGNRKKVGGNKFGNNEVENHVECSKGSGKSKSLNEMGKSEVLAAGEKREGLKVKGSDGFQRKDDTVVGLGFVSDEKLVENEAKDDENVKTGNAVGKYRNKRGNVRRKFGRRELGNNRTVGGNVPEKSEAEMHDESSKGGEKGKDLEEMSKSKVLAVGEKLDGDGFQRKDDKSVDNRLKDDEKVEAKNGLGRYGNGNVGRKFGGPAFGNRRRAGGNKSERSEAEMLVKSSKGDAKGKDSEEMSKSEVLDVGVKLDCLKLIDGNGSQGKDDSLVGVGSNNDQIVGNENRAKDDEKGKAGNEFGKYRNGSGNVGRKFRGRKNYAGNAVGNRGSGRLGGGRMKRSGNVKVWVKKEDKSGANASQVGFTGI